MKTGTNSSAKFYLKMLGFSVGYTTQAQCFLHLCHYLGSYNKLPRI